MVADLETDREFSGEDSFTPYTIGFDITLPICSSFGFKGEFFYGQALSDFRGGIGQSINTARGEEIETLGGWAEFQWDATDMWRLHAGFGIDDPRDGDVATNADVTRDGRKLNWSTWIGTVYNFGGGLKAGVDVIYWETQYDSTGIGNTVRLDFYVQLDF